MNELMEMRRALMGVAKSAEGWDFVWTFRDGLPENNGFTKNASGGSNSYLASDGVVLYANYPFNIQYMFPVQQTINGVVEIVVKFDSLPDDSTAQGFRFCVSNGSNGGQIAVPASEYLSLMTSETATGFDQVAKISIGTWYAIRIALKGPVFDVYLNNKKIVADMANLGVYATQTRIIQQGGGQSTLKSIKYKFS